MWNPLRTLAGRLVLVTIAAIAISHAVVFTLFANERGASLRRLAENAVSERIAYHAQRLRDTPDADRAVMVRNIRDFGVEYRIVHAPTLTANEGAGAQRVARLVSDQLEGAKVFARARVIAVEEPVRWRRRLERNGGATFEPAHRPPPDVIITERGAPPDEGIRIQMRDGDSPRNFRSTELTLNIALGPDSWLEANSRLPAPRPLPSSYIWAALASMLAVAVASILIARQIGRPLTELAGAAKRLGAGDADVSVTPRGPDDIKRASEAFNAMAARLGRQMNRQRHMLWALSHDLRTPITAMRLRAELMEDEAAKQKLLQPLAEMETLTEQALTLARAGASDETREIVDLSEIARTLCGELSELGVNIRAEADAPVLIACRPDEIARALRNLAENASRYGGGGVMRVMRDGENAVAEVADNGAGISPEEITRVMEPFYRADAARSGAGGAGLGLSIVQAIADGHGGRLVLENRNPHGLSAKLIVPAA
ncbi:MAG: HAMP domain-containing sensor histidine kinase [Caulobacterales bacterium]